MGWSNQFIQSLNRSQFKPIYELRFLDVGNSIGDYFCVKSHGSAPFKIGRSGVRVQGTKVIPSRWSTTFGGFTVDFVGDARELFLRTKKGSFAELYCSVDGSQLERIAMGQLQSITRQGIKEQFKLVFRDLLSAFQQTTNSSVGAIPTPSLTNPTQQPLFFQTGIKTPLTAAWNLGDATMSVTDASKFVKGASENGIIKVYKNTAPESFYYIEIASINYGANTFDTSPYSAQVYPSERAGFMLPTSAGGSSAVTCARLDGHPCDLIGKVLTSTGNATNGSLDVYPVSWSVGGGFNHDIFDQGDANQQKQIIRAASSASASNYQWRLVYDKPLSDGLRTIMNTAAQCGQWAVMRQGSISWRGCTDPEGQGMTYSPVVIDHIYDYDIISIRSHELFSTQQQNTYVISTQQYFSSTPITVPYLERTALGAVGGKTLTLPAQREIKRSGVFTYSPAVTRSDCADGDSNRMKNWDHWTWEKITLVTVLRKAHLVAGDVVEITSNYIYGLQEGTGQSYNAKRAMVIGSSFDLSARQCIIELAIISGR